MLAFNALSQDVLVMVGALAAIALIMFLVTARGRSAGWTRVGRIALVVFVVGGVAAWQYFRRQESAFHEGRARDVIALVSIEKQTDAISMLEDIVRIRFRFRNLSDRAVDAFSAYFAVLDPTGGVLIKDQLSIAAPLAPQQTGSWMVKYWATCPQGFSPRTWERLVNQDIEDFEIEWYADGLVFADGQTLR